MHRTLKIRYEVQVEREELVVAQFPVKFAVFYIRRILTR
jgi:hypothetical protein